MIQQSLIPIQKYLFGQNINTFWSKSKINAQIIIVQWFFSTQHPSSSEMLGKALR